MELDVLECGITELNESLIDGSLDITESVRNSDGRMISMLSYIAGNSDNSDCSCRINNLITLGKATVTEETLWYALNNVILPKHSGVLEILLEFCEPPVPLPPDAACLAVKKAIRGTPADSKKCLQLVLDNGGDANSTFVSARENNMDFEMHVSDTPLSIAVQYLPIYGKGTMQLQIIDLLFSHNADPNVYNPPLGESLLHLAARRNSAIVVQRLIDAGAKATLSHSKQSALHVLLQEDRKLNVSKCLQLISHCSEFINTEDSKGNTPIIAFFVSRTKWPISVTPPMISTIFQELVNNGADLSATNSRGQTVAHLVAGLSGQGEMTRAVLQIILKHRPQLLNSISNEGETILHAFNLNVAAVAVAVKHGVDINAKDKTGKTALHIAVERNRIELVTVLLSHGAKGNIKDNHDKTPLDYQTELLKDTDTAKLAKQIRSRIQRAAKRRSEDAEQPPSKYSKKLFHSVLLNDDAAKSRTNILHIPLEIIFHIFGLLDPVALVRCELVCKGWRDILVGPDGTRFWKQFCNAHFWCPKGGWEGYLTRSPRRGIPYSAKGFYSEMLRTTCVGCHRRTSAFSELFDQLVCISCRYSDDRFYYYCKTEINALHLTKQDLQGVVSVTKKRSFRKSTEFRGSDIEPIVFDKYGQEDGVRRLLALEKKRSLARNFNYRLTRLYGHFVEQKQLDCARGS